MNEVLLINRINPKDYTGSKVKVFFLIGDMNEAGIKQKLMDALDQSRIVDKSEIIYKYNGVELAILAQSIPIVIKLLVNSNLNIFGVYAKYNP